MDFRKRPLLSRHTSYGRYSFDITSVTPGFKDKTECIALCMPGSSFIHIAMHSVLTLKLGVTKVVSELYQLYDVSLGSNGRFLRSILL